MRTPNKVLNATHADTQYFISDLDLGKCIEESRSGTAGNRKRASWWGIQLRKSVPDAADRTGRRAACLMGATRHKQRAGPRRRGKEATRC